MSNYSFRAKATPIAMCATIALLAASCVIGEPQPRLYVIEPPNGRTAAKHSAEPGHQVQYLLPVPALSFQAGDALTIRHNTTKLVVLRFEESPSERR